MESWRVNITDQSVRTQSYKSCSNQTYSYMNLRITFGWICDIDFFRKMICNIFFNKSNLQHGFICYSSWLALRFLKDGKGAIYYLPNTIDTCLRLKKIMMSKSEFLYGIYFPVLNGYCRSKKLVHFLITRWIKKATRAWRVDEKNKSI